MITMSQQPSRLPRRAGIEKQLDVVYKSQTSKVVGNDGWKARIPNSVNKQSGKVCYTPSPLSKPFLRIIASSQRSDLVEELLSGFSGKLW